MRAPRRATAPAARNATADDSRVVAVVPALPAPRQPLALNWDAMIDDVTAEPPPLSTPEIKEIVPAFIVSETARNFLDDLGCPSADIDACTCKADLDGLFDIWRYRPPKKMLAALKRKGCKDFSRITTKEVAKALLSKIKTDSPATPNQLEYIKVLQRRANINRPIPDGLSEAAASEMINTLIKTTPATDAQVAELRRLGVDQNIVRVFALSFTYLFFLLTLRFPISISAANDQIP